MEPALEVFTEELEALASKPSVPGVVALLGSSTFRLWENCELDCAPLPVLNLGFGGSTLADCAAAFQVLLRNHSPSALVLYAGDNDLDQGAQIHEITASFRSILHQAREAFGANLPICMISIKPSPSRWGLGGRIRSANRALEEECHAHENVWYLDILPNMLDGDLRPRRKLFGADMLHLSASGYAILSSAIRHWLESVGLSTAQPATGWSEVPASPLLPRTQRLHRNGAHGEDTGEIRRAYHVWHSPNLGREMELLVFGHAGPRLLVFPSRMERFYEWENRGMIHACHEALTEGRLQLWCLDSIDSESFFAFEKPPAQRVERHTQFERYVLEEVLPLANQINPGTPLGTAGCSMGAFHAASLAFRHPDLFQRIVAFSGRYDLSYGYGAEYPDLFQGYRELPLYFLMPNQFLPNLTCPAILGRLREMEVLLAVGEADPLRHSNEALSRILWGRGISHQLKLWVGQAHRFRVWRQMARIYL